MELKDIEILALIAIIFIGTFTIGFSTGRKDVQQEAVKQGVAYYNPTNAVFTWKQ